MGRVAKENIINAQRRIESRGRTESPKREGTVISLPAIDFPVIRHAIGGDRWISFNDRAVGDEIRIR